VDVFPRSNQTRYVAEEYEATKNILLQIMAPYYEQVSVAMKV
jgi:hypothetical protein